VGRPDGAVIPPLVQRDWPPLPAAHLLDPDATLAIALGTEGDQSPVWRKDRAEDSAAGTALQIDDLRQALMQSPIFLRLIAIAIGVLPHRPGNYQCREDHGARRTAPT